MVRTIGIVSIVLVALIWVVYFRSTSTPPVETQVNAASEKRSPSTPSILLSSTHREDRADRGHEESGFQASPVSNLTEVEFEALQLSYRGALARKFGEWLAHVRKECGSLSNENELVEEGRRVSERIAASAIETRRGRKSMEEEFEFEVRELRGFDAGVHGLTVGLVLSPACRAALP